VRWVLVAASAAVVVYLAAVSLGAPTIGLFGSTGSVATIVLTCALIAGACVLSLQARSNRPGSIPIGVIAGLSLTSGILAFSSFYRCERVDRPKIITAFIWTATVVKGGVDDHSLSNGPCPSPTPVALEIARLAGLSAVFIGVFSVAVALLQTQWDRTRVRIAKSVAAVVDLDEDARPMVAAIARTLEAGSQLAVLVPAADLTRYADLRAHGARVLEADFTDADSWSSARWWRRIDRLYLLSPDASSNLRRLATLNADGRTAARRRRLPLVVRIDDPWLAQSWRARRMGQSDTRWLADAVSKYELAAGRLLDRLLAGGAIRTLLVCGSSPLTLALCADITRRRAERSYCEDDTEPEPPTVTLVSRIADEYAEDFLLRQEQLGLSSPAGWLTAIREEPTMPTLAALITAAEHDAPGSAAAILVDPGGGSALDPSLGTRLAARFPMLPLLAWDANAVELQDVPAIIGQLQQYRLAMDVGRSQGPDVWERAARLIHTRYARTVAKAPDAATISDATKPWAELSEFYRGSNRRQVRNAMWMVETIGGHTWDAFGGQRPAQQVPVDAHPLVRLAAIGFDRTAALAMAEAEHEDWCCYLRDNGWRYGPTRNDADKIHDKLQPWAIIRKDKKKRRASLNSLAETLYALGELGYRSRPLWERYARDGTVTAVRRDEPWTWTAEHGETMHAAAGDWSVREGQGRDWSVRDDIFRASYQHVSGTQWRRTGFVDARPARAGETIATLEGPVLAAAGSWVLRRQNGDQWPVSADWFARNYSGPIAAPVSLADPGDDEDDDDDESESEPT
jgi:hypothetical protein